MEKKSCGESMLNSILVFNVGSSSIKYSLFEDSNLLKSGNKERLKSKEDYNKALQEIFLECSDKKIDFLAHRVVHGGELKKTSLITSKVKKKIKQFSEFAPLHNPKQLMVIELCEKFKKPQYAVFDTMFFAELPEVSKTYAIPKKITEKYDIRKYGFHGLSHEYVSQNLKGKTITCQVRFIFCYSANKPLDQSGLTPQKVMGNPLGKLDPELIILAKRSMMLKILS